MSDAQQGPRSDLGAEDQRSESDGYDGYDGVRVVPLSPGGGLPRDAAFTVVNEGPGQVRLYGPRDMLLFPGDGARVDAAGKMTWLPAAHATYVTAADFNGRDWDGSPFSDARPWLEEAVRDGRIKVAPIGDRDYAVFDVETAAGVVRALPGDRIECGDDGKLTVVEEPDRRGKRKYRDDARLPLPADAA